MLSSPSFASCGPKHTSWLPGLAQNRIPHHISTPAKDRRSRLHTHRHPWQQPQQRPSPRTGRLARRPVGWLLGACLLAAVASPEELVRSNNMLRILIMGGDNMLGRAVQLTLRHQTPGDDRIQDSLPAAYYLVKAFRGDRGVLERERLHEIRSENREGKRLWGDVIGKHIVPPPHLRLLNLETAVTESISNADVPDKGINYHMHSANLAEALGCLGCEGHGGDHAVPYVVSFSNNHVLDFGRKAFDKETLEALKTISPPGMVVGAGASWSDAAKPAVVRIERRGAADVSTRVFAMATGCSGTPADWGASERRSGIVYVPPLYSSDAVQEGISVLRRMIEADGAKRQGTLDVLSVHFGGNWAYRQTFLREDGQTYRREFVHRAIDELGIDLVYGHSSHHIRGIEVYKGKLVLYGAGDFINDYEGFKNPGDEAYSHEGGMFVVDLDPSNGTLKHLRVIPTMMDRLSVRVLNHDTTGFDPNRKAVIEKGLGAVRDLCTRLNRLSEMDAGTKGMPVKLHVLEHGDAAVPGGALILAWEPPLDSTG